MRKSLVLLAFALICSFGSNAKVKLPAVFSDNLVLQQNSNVNLWGEATPERDVTIVASWNKAKKIRIKTDEKGKWKVKIPTPGATSAPQEITISDGSTIKLKNVLIGEVWLCSGQSNMEMPIKGFNNQQVDGSLDLIVGAKPQTPIRMFTVERKISNTPLSDCVGKWMENTSEGVAMCSATAYFFAQYLNKILDIPIGIIIADWGGTYIQPWMSRESIEPLGYDMKHLNGSEIEKSDQSHNKPCRLFNGMIAPLVPYTIKGLIWYQGESNCYNPTEYEKLMPAFIEGWRKKFDVGEFPFYYVQIAPYHYWESDRAGAPEIRLVQSRLMNKIANAGMVVTADIGDQYCIHPTNKETVGKRLAYWALAKNYKKNEFAYSGPIYKSMRVDGHTAYIYFENTGGGVSPTERELAGFEIAGEDGIFHPANAHIEAWTGILSLSSDKVPAPVKVRYGYSDYFVGSIFDNFGLPASPFNASIKN